MAERKFDLAIVVGTLTSRSGFPMGEGETEVIKYPNSALASVEQEHFENDLTLLPDVGLNLLGCSAKVPLKKLHVFAGNQAAARAGLKSGARGMGAVHLCGAESLSYLESPRKDVSDSEANLGNFGRYSLSAFKKLYKIAATSDPENGELDRAARVLHFAALLRMHVVLAERSLYRTCRSAVIAVPREIMTWKEDELKMTLYGAGLKEGGLFVDRTVAGFLGANSNFIANGDGTGKINWDGAVSEAGRSQPIVDFDGICSMLRFCKPNGNDRTKPEFWDNLGRELCRQKPNPDQPNPEQSDAEQTDPEKLNMERGAATGAPATDSEVVCEPSVEWLWRTSWSQEQWVSPSLFLRRISSRPTQSIFDADTGTMRSAAYVVAVPEDQEQGPLFVLPDPKRMGPRWNQRVDVIPRELEQVKMIFSVGDGFPWENDLWNRFQCEWKQAMEQEVWHTGRELPQEFHSHVARTLRGASLLCETNSGIGKQVDASTSQDVNSCPLGRLLTALANGEARVDYAPPRRQFLEK